MGFLYLQNELKLQTAVVSLIEGQDCAEFFQPLSTRCDLLGRSMQRRFYMVQGDAWRSTGWMREDLGGPEKQGVTWWLWKLLHRALTTNVLILQVPPSTMAPMWLKSLHGVKQGELAALIHPPEDGIQPGFRWWVCVDLHHHAGIVPRRWSPGPQHCIARCVGVAAVLITRWPLQRAMLVQWLLQDDGPTPQGSPYNIHLQQVVVTFNVQVLLPNAM